MPSAGVVKSLRAETGLSVRALAEAAGVAASTVHRIEMGTLDPTVSTLTRLVEGAGAQLVVRVEHDSTASLWGWGAWLADQPDLDDTVWPVRHAAALNARFESSTLDVRRGIIAASPRLTGDRRWDAFAGALAAWMAARHGMEAPLWTTSADRRLGRGWWVSPMESMRAWEYAGSPAPFRHRGIYLHRDSLTNV